MAKIKITKDGENVGELELQREQEYVLGRADDSPIVLEALNVSRKHISIRFVDEAWVCTAISKLGAVMFNGISTPSLNLLPGMIFVVGPFSIEFTSEESAPEIAAPETDTKEYSYFLRQLDNLGNEIDETDLIGEPITIGRSSDANIILDAKNGKAGRIHCILTIEDGEYAVESKSGHSITVNEQRVKKKRKLQNGDQIGGPGFAFRYIKLEKGLAPVVMSQISKTEREEEPGEKTQEKVIPLPAVSFDAPVVQIEMSDEPSSNDIVVGKKRNHSKSRKNKEGANPLTVILLLLVIAAGAYMYLEEPAPKPIPQNRDSGQTSTQASTNPQNSKMTPQQKKFIEDTYYQAEILFRNGKYDLAGVELEKVLQVDSQNKDALKLKDLCIQGLEQRRIQQERERLAEQQQVLIEKINNLVANCERLVRANRLNEVENCVSKITEYDPENQRARELLEKVSAKESAKQEAIDSAAERAQVKRFAISTFESAQRALQEKKYKIAIGQYQKVLNTEFTDPEGIKAKATQGIKTARDRTVSESNSLYQEGKVALETKDYKVAIDKLGRSLKINPENGDAQITKEKAEKELYNELKKMYQESVVDESLGSVDASKKKWREIIELSPVNNEYHQKAKLKLGKYEK